MAEGGGEERVSIRQSAKSHKKYGSTSNHMKRTDVYIKHSVIPSDTLQGIALKYGVTTEQIRRVNKIWANDSLFLRNTLDIPVSRSCVDAICWEEANGTSDLTSGYIAGEAATNGPRRTTDGGLRRNSAPTESAIMHDAVDDKFDQTIADILIRIDSSIARTKSQVEKREKQQQFYSDDSLYSQRRRSHQARMRQSISQQQDETDPQVVVHPVVMTQGRKVQSSLQKLQREQDEMFEL